MLKETKVFRKNLIWDKTLFMEGVRQTKWIALATVIVGGILHEFNRLDPLVSAIMVCVMLYRLFRFSNKRNSSDFYNALCKSKTTVYVSYLSVVLLWCVIFLIICTLLCFFVVNIKANYYYGDDISTGTPFVEYSMEWWLYKFEIPGCYLAYLLLAIGAFAIGMTTTGNAITHVLVMLIILLAPRFICSYYLSGYYDIVPFISPYEDISRFINNDLNIIYDGVSGMFNRTKGLTLFYSFVWLPVLYSGVVGIILMIVAGILFKKKKSEDAGVVALNGFWKFVLRTTLAFVIAIAADLGCAKCIFNGVHADVNISSIVIFYLISILVWLLFDWFTGRNKKNMLKSVLQLPVFIVMNLIVVGSICYLGYEASEVPEFTDIKSVSIDYINYNYNDSKSYDSYQRIDNFIDMAGESYLENAKVSELIYNRFSNDMMRFKNPSINYSLNINSDDYMRISIETDSDKMDRYVTVDGYLLQEIANVYIESAADIYDYVLPIKTIDPTDYNKYQLGVMNSFTWDFSFDEINEIYDCFYEEATTKKYPLKTFLDKEYNIEGTFEFLAFYDSTMGRGEVFLPIGVNSPKALEKLAQISNAKRTDFDFQWFTDYVNSIGNEEKGATLDVLLYTEKDPNIRYEAFSFWSNYTADLSDENLNKLLEITNAHKSETDFAADENILVILYRDIENKSPTCKWFNISDAEAEIVDSIIWKDGYFNALKYSNYNY